MRSHGSTLEQKRATDASAIESFSGLPVRARAPSMKEVGLTATNGRYFPQLRAHKGRTVQGCTKPHEQPRNLNATLGRCGNTGPALAYTPQPVRTIGMWQICLTVPPKPT
jgi:hypothetical protein